MMRVEIKRSVMISGEPVKAGSFAEVENAVAMLLIGMGKAAYAPAEPVTESKPEPEAAPACPPVKPVPRRGRSTSPNKD
jgi:hypothetical protein